VLFVIGDSPDAVLAHAIGPRAGVIVGEEIPGVAVVAVILTFRSPLPLGQVGAPFLLRLFLLTSFFEPVMFCSFHRTPFPFLKIMERSGAAQWEGR
jgi:hypothetical protein